MIPLATSTACSDRVATLSTRAAFQSPSSIRPELSSNISAPGEPGLSTEVTAPSRKWNTPPALPTMRKAPVIRSA
jgi:hypothetical protein